jgi:putative phosphoesterase
VNPASVKLFKGLKLVGIFGNNDGDKFRLINSFNEVGAEIKGDFHEFELDGLKFACYHGTEPQLKNSLIDSGTYDVVMYGHTHAPLNKKVGNTLVLNPGTSHGFWKRATVMVFDTETREPEIIDL